MGVSKCARKPFTVTYWPPGEPLAPIDQSKAAPDGDSKAIGHKNKSRCIVVEVVDANSCVL